MKMENKEKIIEFEKFTHEIFEKMLQIAIYEQQYETLILRNITNKTQYEVETKTIFDNKYILSSFVAVEKNYNRILKVFNY